MSLLFKGDLPILSKCCICSTPNLFIGALCSKSNSQQAGVELGLTQAETVSLELDLIKGLIKIS